MKLSFDKFHIIVSYTKYKHAWFQIKRQKFGKTIMFRLLCVKI